LESSELKRLDDAIMARPLTIFAWEIAHGRKPIDEIPETLKFLRRVSREIGNAARNTVAQR
jgi:hypothetical protein